MVTPPLCPQGCEGRCLLRSLLWGWLTLDGLGVGNQRLRLMLRLWTMSSVGSGTTRSSTGMRSTLPWKTKSAAPSRASNKEPSLTNRGPLSRASPTVRPIGKNPGMQTSMYDSWGLPTVKADPLVLVVGIGGNTTEDLVWCPKLPVKMHEDLQSQNKVQVFYMNDVDVRFEALGNCVINQRQGQYKWKSAKTKNLMF